MIPSYLVTFGNVLAIIVTIGIFSMPFTKDNPWYRLVEALFVGGSLGNVTVVTINSIMSRGITPILKGDIINIIPVLLGIAFYTRYIANMSWMSTWPLAIIVSIGGAYTLRSMLVVSTHTHLKTFLNLFLVDKLTLFNIFTAFVCTLALFGTAFYFVFTVRRENKVLVNFRKIGRFFLIILYASQVGGMFFGYSARAASRLVFLLQSFGII